MNRERTALGAAMRALVCQVLFLVVAGYASISLAGEQMPIHSRNQNPFVQIFGLPVAESGFVAEADMLQTDLFIDFSNTFSGGAAGAEFISIDGETTRLTLLLRYGLGEAAEIGIDIPFMGHGGGFLDAPISDFHRIFGMSAAGRNLVARNRIDYRYAANGSNRINVNRSVSGVGDVQLSGAYQLWRDDTRALALRVGLKLPTGEAAKLLGSGATDLSLRLSYSDKQALENADVSLFGSLGAIVLGNGKVMPEIQRHWVGLASVGAGWQAWDGFTLKVQVDGHTPSYNSNLDELGLTSAQLVVGGSFHLSRESAIDLAFSEDIIVDTAPDVAFHLAWRCKF